MSAEQVLNEVAVGWSAENRQTMVDYLSAEARREVIKHAYKDAADLAANIDPSFIITPAVQTIAQDIEYVLDAPRCNLLVTMPPQEGKSTLCTVWTPLRALMKDLNCRMILAAHGDSLAAEASMACQNLIRSHGSGVVDPVTGVEVEDKLGYRLAPGASTIKNWKVRGGKGGMLAAGVGSSIVGRPADLFIIDDPYKTMAEADSENYRKKIQDWFTAVARTRLGPNASMILIQTRWHPNDLAGWVLANQLSQDRRFRTWRHINIPAISEAGIKDSLGREPGVAMISARGRTKAEFEEARRDVGERVFYAMYQGAPQPPGGGLFKREWFEPHAPEPVQPLAAIIGLDPADTGEDDATGIIAGVLNPDRSVVFTEDWSGKFTADQWGTRAVKLALTVNAREIALEAYSTAVTFTAVLKRAYRAIHTDAIHKQAAGVELTEIESRALTELPPFTIYKWRAGAKIDAVGRSALLRQALETRKARVVESKMDQLVDDACGWQIGQHQPDRVAAAVITHDRLALLASGLMVIAEPPKAPAPPPARSELEAMTSRPYRNPARTLRR